MTTSIETQIAEFNEGFDAQIGPVLARTFAGEQEDLRAAGLPDGVVKVGDALPEASLLAADASATDLSTVLAGAPAVLVFYRGAWCPYCNITLKTYQAELLPALTAQGVGLVAISPQHPDRTADTVSSAGLGFTVLSDPSNALAATLGIVTAPSAEARSAHTELGFEVSDNNADGTPGVPFPTVLLVDAAGTVRFVDVQVDYTSRTEVQTVLEAVRQL